MTHTIFGRELRGTGYNSIRDFRVAYLEMRRKLESIPEATTVPYKTRSLETITKPNVKLHFCFTN